MALVGKRPGNTQRRVLGIRVSAAIEILAFLAAALAIDALTMSMDRFAGVSPHPFWIIVLLAAVQYGTNEALAAATLATAALLVGNLPEQGFAEDLDAWLLRATTVPVLWFIAAVVLGEIREGHRREADARQEELSVLQEHARAMVDAYERLSRIKGELEARVAGQVHTVRAMYDASRAIEREHTGEVLAGAASLVRSVLRPGKFSLFALNGQVLEVVANEGWTPEDRYVGEFDASSALFETVVIRREVLAAANPQHEAILQHDGVLAGPLVSEETGRVVGMLKIEELPFLEFNPSTVHNFRIVCDWIGTAYARAERIGRLRDGPRVQPLFGDGMAAR